LKVFFCSKEWDWSCRARWNGRRNQRHLVGSRASDATGTGTVMSVVGSDVQLKLTTAAKERNEHRGEGRMAETRGFRSVTRPAWHILRAVASELCVPGLHRVCRYRGRLGPRNLAPTPFQKKSVKVPLTESYPWRRESQSMQAQATTRTKVVLCIRAPTSHYRQRTV
jgi:hypothetical protein